jgi:hypothetical protein
MDGSGIDFTEADFGSEAGLQSPLGTKERSAEDWQRWSDAPIRFPIGLIVMIVGSVLLVISFPMLAEWLLSMKQQPQPQQQQQQQQQQTERTEQTQQQTVQRPRLFDPGTYTPPAYDPRFGSPR